MMIRLFEILYPVGLTKQDYINRFNLFFETVIFIIALVVMNIALLNYINRNESRKEEAEAREHYRKSLIAQDVLIEKEFQLIEEGMKFYKNKKPDFVMQRYIKELQIQKEKLTTEQKYKLEKLKR